MPRRRHPTSPVPSTTSSTEMERYNDRTICGNRSQDEVEDQEMSASRRYRSGRTAAYVLMAVLGGLVGAFGIRLMEGRAGAFGAPVRPYTQVVEAGQPAAS